MSRRALLTFVVLNVIVTFATVAIIINVWTRVSPQPTPRAVVSPLVVEVTKIVYITTTPDPNQSANPGSQGATLPGTLVTDSGVPTAVLGLSGVPTLDPSLLPPGQNSQNTPSGTESVGISVVTAAATSEGGCPTYTIKQGDIAGNVATTFGVSLTDLMQANNLTERDLTRLQIGQVLIIPVSGCGLATATPSVTPTRFVVPTLPPTVTLVPTAAKTQVEIVQVISPGDITTEGIEIRNVSGGVIQMQGWTITDAAERTFTFPPEYRMFPGGRVTVYSRAGTNTPIVLYWGQSRPVWTDPALEITILDSKGEVQTRRTVSGQPVAGTSEASDGLIPTETPEP
jgi:LysM repeat protein